MREPRPKQIFPPGGKILYELLRSDHEPVFIDLFPEGECYASRARMADTLTYRTHFDPMLYFWPVEGQHVVARFKAKPADFERLVKALQRDGAMWITLIYHNELPADLFDPNFDIYSDIYTYEHWGDAEEFMRRRYGPPAVDAVAVSGGGSGSHPEGTGALPANSRGISNGIRKNNSGDGTIVSGS